MTALSVVATPAQVFELNWPRISAYSGSFSLHCLLALAMLIPPLAMEMRRVSEEPPTIVTISSLPPPAVPEPVLPVPPVKMKLAPAPPRPQITITAPIANPLPMPVSAPGDLIAAPSANAQATTGASSGDGAADAVPSALAYKERTTVVYPRDALLRGEHGTVLLRVLVGTDGNVQQIEIDKSSGSRSLDNAARVAVAKWRFKPGMRGGAAYAAWALVPISFKLP